MFHHAPTQTRLEAATLLAPRATRQSQPATARLLLVCDSAAGAARLRSALGVGAVEIVSARDCAELRRVCEQEYALAVIDVAPAKLLDLLRTIRANESLSRLPVFVEASAIIAEASFAGVLPQYRAMPCGYDDLVALVRQRLAPTERTSNQGKVL
jgi:CheY-like chemotaxis protein